MPFCRQKGGSPQKGWLAAIGGGIEKCLFAAKKAAAFKRAGWPPLATALKNAYWFELSLLVRGQAEGVLG